MLFNSVLVSFTTNSNKLPIFLLIYVLSNRQFYSVYMNTYSIKSWNHRMVCIGKNLKDHLLPTPLLWAEILSTVSECPKPDLLQLGFGYFQGGGNPRNIYSFSGQLLLSQYPLGKEFFPNI